MRAACFHSPFVGLLFQVLLDPALASQPEPRPGAAQNPVRYPFRSFDGGRLIHQQRSGTRGYDVNTDGVDHYGLEAAAGG